jgi:hypothetical protein
LLLPYAPPKFSAWPDSLLPQFIEAWSLTNTQAGWLAGIVSAARSILPRASASTSLGKWRSAAICNIRQ